jgi:multicomponent K+:H+ antiporter subunit F
MLIIAAQIALALVGVAIVLGLWRLWRGPALADRILALDTITINAIAVVLILDIILDTAIYFEAALILAMMGFVGTVALGKFLLGGDVIE